MNSVAKLSRTELESLVLNSIHEISLYELRDLCYYIFSEHSLNCSACGESLDSDCKCHWFICDECERKLNNDM